MGEHELAATHYRRLIERRVSVAPATNNLGIIAANLRLDLVAADLYRDAAKAGSDESIGNLAAVMERVGLRDEASSLIEQARRDGRSTSRLDRVAGDLARRDESERELLEAAVLRGISQRAWRVKEGLGLMSPDVTLDTFIGDYTSGPYPFHIEVNTEGVLVGWFQRGYQQFATFVGTIVGGTMQFSWLEHSSNRPPPTAITLLTMGLPLKHGKGCLLIDNGRLVGDWNEKSTTRSTEHHTLLLQRVDSAQAPTLDKAMAPIATSLMALLGSLEK